VREIIRMNRGSLEAYAKVMATRSLDPIVTVLGHLRMSVLHEDESVVQWLRKEGIWESWVTLAAGRRVADLVAAKSPRVPKVLNIGANFGYYSLLFAALGADVVAVEPQPRLAACIRQSTVLNGLEDRMRVVECVVGAAHGPATLRVPNRCLGGASLLPVGAHHADVLWDGAVVETTCEPLADMPVADFIFVDAEGWEPHIFMPAEAFLKEHMPVVCLEFSPDMYDDPKAFARWWTEIGYETLLVEHDGSERVVDLQQVTEQRMITMVPNDQL